MSCIPKTQNEVDLYNCPIEDLKKLDILDIQIKTVDTKQNQNHGDLDDNGINNNYKNNTNHDKSNDNLGTAIDIN